MTNETPLLPIDRNLTRAERIARIQAGLNESMHPPEPGSPKPLEAAVVSTPPVGIVPASKQEAEPKSSKSWFGTTPPGPPPHTHWFIPEGTPTIEVSDVRGYTQEPSKGGMYLNQAAHRLWLPVDTPAGFITIHVQGDPEPVSGRRPIGITDKDVEYFAGDFMPRWFGAAFRPPEGEEPPTPAWVKWAAISGAALLVLGLIIYILLGWA